ncbi:hypothetical protein KHQ06_15960 [Nocardia tengchongensis]|uniref:Uncharacterized protein n=1 Tax=Nocardia tengchongensis TaxID=2055889 RepID=A0ABX8CXB8_9NOCA|nr:hypothetical protein [Nocardia tengchongensis]QVI24134.1 hypothetical protein KHQ06_15960 [Nocardia tengchongensis]
MAYLGTSAHACADGSGHGGRGMIEMHWHRMPDATVELLSAEDCRGDIQIRWRFDTTFEGMFANLSVGEARTLRDNLTAAIATFEPITTAGDIDNEVDDAAPVTVDGTVLTSPEDPVHCYRCGGRIALVSNSNDYWWTHEPYSINDHEPVLAKPIPCEHCGAAIDLVDDGIEVYWVHEVDPIDSHTAHPVPAAAPEIGEVA